MFLNNPVSTRSILSSNENATAFIRSKSNSENTFNEKTLKTPHCNKDGAPSKSGQTTQRRRRAFGDISNRKTVVTKGGGKGGAVSKQKLPNNNLTKRSSVSINNGTAQVKFFKSPSTKMASVNKPRPELGAESSLKSSKHEQHTMPENSDQVVGVTTRWSDENIAEESRSLFDLVPEDELNLVSNLRDEMMDKQTKENCQVERLEIAKGEKQLLEQVRELHQADVQEIGTMLSTCNIHLEKDGELDFLNQKLPWEEEDQSFVTSEEQYSLGVDPYNLWDDL